MFIGGLVMILDLAAKSLIQGVFSLQSASHWT
jgi:hypothetical protein